MPEEEEHARKVYAAELSPGTGGAQVLAGKIRSGAVTDGQTVREIGRPRWVGLTTTTAVRDALTVLSQAGWVRIVAEDTGGRPTEILRLHPALRRGSGA